MKKYIAYTNNDDGSINILAGSPNPKVFEKILPAGTKYEVHEGETFTADGKTWLSAENKDYIKTKAVADIKADLRKEAHALKEKLSASDSDIGDWKVIKCYEARINSKDLPYDWDELTAQREQARARINAIEDEIKELDYDLTAGRCIYCHGALSAKGNCKNKKCDHYGQ